MNSNEGKFQCIVFFRDKINSVEYVSVESNEIMSRSYYLLGVYLTGNCFLIFDYHFDESYQKAGQKLSISARLTDTRSCKQMATFSHMSISPIVRYFCLQQR